MTRVALLTSSGLVALVVTGLCIAVAAAGIAQGHTGAIVLGALCGLGGALAFMADCARFWRAHHGQRALTSEQIGEDAP
jgi:hypothetical protein